ncbi:hypothetical protein EDB85DRAFT_177955 [Lactarius pseudohatsudake]|nr:hypothetical protein EDB85DRAFT_177955 [Lactarius pseudohatsudake]
MSPLPKTSSLLQRCNRRLCTTLLNPSNVMIWRRARSHCIIPGLPPPPPGWSEPAYAALIFDAGNCDVCGVWTQRMFLSFVVRVRLCGKHECRKIFLNEHLVLRALAFNTESKEFFLQHRLRRLDLCPSVGSVPPWPSDHTYYYCRVFGLTWKRPRQNTRRWSQREYLGMTYCVRLISNSDVVYSSMRCYYLSGAKRGAVGYRLTQASNTAFARNHARAAGWDLHDLLNNPTYLSLHRSHKLCLETIPERVVNSLTTRIDTEILSQMEKKERKQKTHAQQIRRADIARHYDRLVERKSHPMLPTLAEFRGLPIIKALQDRDDTAPLPSDSANSSSAGPVKISRVLKSELKRPQLIGGMINSDLKQWADTALREFDAILGTTKLEASIDEVTPPLREG